MCLTVTCKQQKPFKVTNVDPQKLMGQINYGRKHITANSSLPTKCKKTKTKNNCKSKEGEYMNKYTYYPF